MDKTFYDSFKIKSNSEFEPKIAVFFDNFSDFFTSDAHCGIFLLGVLTQFLLNIQMRERGATPFRSRLKGLKMDAREVSWLLPEIISKLEQYKANYYRPLEVAVSKYLVSAGTLNRSNIPVDEVNFIFALGMTLSPYFKIRQENDVENEKEATDE